MFNFNDFENETNKNVQLSDIKVFANNKIRLGKPVIATIGLTEGKRLIITKNNKSGQVAIYATELEGLGRAVNTKGEFTHQNVATILGGQHSEWALNGEGVENPTTGDVWFELKETVKGSEEIERLAELANENGTAEVISDAEEVSEGSEEVEVPLEEASVEA